MPAVNPTFVSAQVVPPSVVLKTPFEVPANAVEGACGSMTTANAKENGPRTRLQLDPPSLLLKMWAEPFGPTWPAAKSVVGVDGSIASAWTMRFSMPVFAACQLLPPSSLL